MVFLYITCSHTTYKSAHVPRPLLPLHSCINCKLQPSLQGVGVLLSCMHHMIKHFLQGRISVFVYLPAAIPSTHTCCNICISCWLFHDYTVYLCGSALSCGYCFELLCGLLDEVCGLCNGLSISLYN